jgi:hypothetical protein
MMLRPHADSALPILMKEAAALFPGDLDTLSRWQAPWYRAETTASAPSKRPARIELDPSAQTAAALLRSQPATLEALAGALGLPTAWSSDETTVEPDRPSEAPRPEDDAVRALLRAFPSTLQALASSDG